MNFSICMIAKNEANTLPKCVQSLQEFMSKGGWVGLVDTGSTDGTPDIARSLGVNVFEVGEKFITKIDLNLSIKINQKFVVTGEKNVVEFNSKLFDFAAARNHIADLAPTNMVMAVDCDEAFTVLDLDFIEDLINQGYERLETDFVFAHDAYGNPAIQFLQSRFYDKRVIKYVGIVHEVPLGPGKTFRVPRDKFLLEHFQEQGKGHRSNYLTGLSLDCYLNPASDRNSHYFAREMMWTGRIKSAIKEFLRHTEMKNAWPAEQAQSMIFLGDCYGMLNRPLEQIQWYSRAFFHDPTRREALIKTALFYRHNDVKPAVAAYASAALEIPFTPFYANDMVHYRNLPHELLYWAKGWMGDIEGAKEHLLKALYYDPRNPSYLRDTQFYFEYPDNKIEGWMDFEELLWLYEQAKKFNVIFEIGSWKGRSTHALLTGTNQGRVYSVDHFMGSEDPNETGHKDVFDEFWANVGHFQNLTVFREHSEIAYKNIHDGFADMIFIDGGHQYHEVKRDIMNWLPKCNTLICGHDYGRFDGVTKAVDEIFGKPDSVTGSIWAVNLGNRSLIQDFKLKILQNKNFSFVKKGDGELACIKGETGKNADGIEYVQELKNGLIHAYNYFESFENVYVYKQGQKHYNTFLHSVDNNLEHLSDFYQTIKKSNRLKIYIGPQKLYSAVEYLEAVHFIIPDTMNMTTFIEALLNLQKQIKDDCILLFSCGLFAKLLIHNCLSYNPNITCLDIGSGWDPLIEKSRTMQIPVEEILKHYPGFYKEESKIQIKERIPKEIFTIWLSEDNNIPPLINRCIESQKIKGYKHKLITLENCFKDHEYMQQCLNSRHEKEKWCKASDFLRVHYLLNHGGIYLDADVEVLLGKNFDSFLHHRMFAGYEKNEFIGTAVLGAEKDYPFLTRWLHFMTSNFRGDDSLIIESSIEPLTYGYRDYDWYKKEFEVYPYEYFYPYSHGPNEVKITDKTITYHYFYKSWSKTFSYPSVSIIIPTLNRPEGLQKCLDSIYSLNYPLEKVEIKVIYDNPRQGVPLRMKQGVQETTGEYIVYAANDIEFTPNSLLIAVNQLRIENKRLGVFNTGLPKYQDGTSTCEHFIIKRSLIPEIGGEIFDTEFNHVGVDDLLLAKCKKLNEVTYCENAVVKHYHFSRGGVMDNTYELGWKDVDKDRELLNKKLQEV